MSTRIPNHYFSNRNIMAHSKQGASHSPNIRLLPQASTNGINNVNREKSNVNNSNNKNNIAPIKSSYHPKPNNKSNKYPYANQNKIQVIGDLNTFQIHQSNLNANMYSSTHDFMLAQKHQQNMPNQQMSNMNNRFKRKPNKNIPRKSPIPIIQGHQMHQNQHQGHNQQQQNCLQVIKPLLRNNNNSNNINNNLNKVNQSNDELSKIFKDEKLKETRSLSPIPRNTIQQGNNNLFNPNLLKPRFVSKSPILGRATFLDKFKKFHITSSLNFHNSSSNKVYLKNSFANLNVYKLNSIMQSKKDINLVDACTEVKNNNTLENSKCNKINQDEEFGGADIKDGDKYNTRAISAIDKQSKMNMPNQLDEGTNGNLTSTKVVKEIYQIYTFTHVGFDGEKEKDNNQDAFFIEKNFGGNANNIYMSVCDGHGLEGHFVSGFIKEILPLSMSQNLHGIDLLNENINEIAIQTFLDVNDKLVCNEDINSTFSGSTCVSVIYTPERLICLNIGDSRAVVGRCVNGKWKEVNLSRDHKPTETDEAKRIIACNGKIQPFIDEGEFIGPPRVWIKEDEVPGLAMTRSFGDRVAASVGVVSEPEITYYNFNSDDKFFIIASDGVWEFINSNQCINIIKDFYLKKNIKGCCEYLYSESKTRWINEEEVVDDITMIVVFLN